MTGPYFVDTNVLVYARDQSEADKQPLAHQWVEYLWRTRQGRISVQVLQEYYQVVTRRLTPGLPADVARNDVRDLFAWAPVRIDSQVLETAWKIQDRFGFSWWDALIVASAQEAGCRFLLTEDLQHGQDLDGLTTLSPFTSVPAFP